ncbi:plexin-B-like [Mercenaria mercenaria]|uniref:plexin-B-like n=1 Tax=Mercenaria mercenaria TaxID=6596 RepID=UPI00234F562B|nr:plexin-B-like [Mercenaria mercenaria]
MTMKGTNFTVQILTLFVVGVNAGLQFDTARQLPGPLTNFVSHEGKFFIGGTDRLYVLNDNLGIIQTANTCNLSAFDCNNVNKILLIHKEWLITCGTGNNGICELRNTSDLTLIWVNDLKVSTDIQRPAQGMITKNGYLTIAITFGEGIRQYFMFVGVTYKYAISTRELPSFALVQTLDSSRYLQLIIEKHTAEDYLIYYKASFQNNWMTYFVTNQKQYVGSKEYISKLVRICQNDTDYGSYTDIVLHCEHEGLTYNLIQNAILLDASSMQSGKIFAGIFTRGNDPENPQGDSVICVTNLQFLDNAIMDAKKAYAVSCESVENARRYLRSYKGDICLSEEIYRELDFNCNVELPLFRYVIGKNVFAMQSNIKFMNKDGIITTMYGTIYDGRPVVMLGTSTGKLIQMNLLKNLSLEIYAKEVVDDFLPIRAIYTKDENALYLMNSRRIISYFNTNCSECQTCAETMAVRNPLCGWCIFSERATRHSECSNATDYWLSSHQECVLISVEPPGIHFTTLSKHSNLTVTITVQNFPAKQDNGIYTCRFLRGLHLINITAAQQLTMNTVFCEIPPVSVHTEAAIELLLKTNLGTTAVLSSAPFLYYECGYFKRCAECVSTNGANCHWCSKTATCQMSNSCSVESVSEITACPQVLDQRGSYFIPNGIETAVEIKIANLVLDPTLIYKCIVPEALHEVRADVIANNSITCSLNILMSGSGKKHYRIVISYGSQNGMLAEINDVFNNSVTVYSCQELSSDCSHCRALNKTRYTCDWCGNSKCIYSKLSCLSICPAPIITKVIPKDGPVQGGTKLTLSGTNLGRNVSEVEGVTVAGRQCSLSSFLEDYDVPHSDDFETQVPSRLVCTTGKASDETTGTIDVTVNGKTSISEPTFTYKKVKVTHIFPTFGPQAGGTKITLNGDNLGIGNRQIEVVLGSKSCKQALVYPNISLKDDFRGNFTVECVVQSSLKIYNVTGLFLQMEDMLVLSNSTIAYSYVTDPVVKAVSPLTGFASGGTKVTVSGKYLDNAHYSFMQTMYKEEFQMEICEIKSSEKTLCKVPEAPRAIKHLILEQLETCLGCVELTAVIGFDGVRRYFTITYFPDPLIHRLPGDGNVVTLDSNSYRLKINGEYLNLVATTSDVSVTVGVEPCAVINLTLVSILCIAPATKPLPGIPGVENPEVNITIGNIHRTVGYVQYKEEVKTVQTVQKVDIVFSVVGALAFIALAVFGIFLIYRKYRKMQNSIRYLERTKTENETTDIAMEIRYTTAAAVTGKHESTLTYDDISENDMVTDNELPRENVYEKLDGYLESRTYLRLNVENEPCGVEHLGGSGSSKECNLQDKDYIHPTSDSSS